jgi:asparagine synthase (glutamine-hydrolysing)
MSAALAHRGPDSAGTRIDRRSEVAVAMRRLSIVDLDGGHQPLSNEHDDVWTVFNGEIYNHPGLLEHLAARGHRLRSRCDTEVLVHLYEEYGEELVHALEGMFAFALWDARRRRLLLARDRFGEKPLFYARRPGAGLVFASELTALLRGLPAEPEVDADAVDAFFVFGYVPGPATILAGIRQLPPGHLLVWDADSDRMEVRPYWSPPPPSSDACEPLAELTAETLRLLDASVRARLVADVPVGVFLSGGVDSALVATLAAEAAARPVKTFTVGYDMGSVNETDAAGRGGGGAGTEHHELVCSERDVAERVPALLGRLDQPLADQAVVPLHALSEFARDEVKVVMGGEGADELFGGYPRYRWLERRARVAGVLPPLPIGDRAQGARTALGQRTNRLIDLATHGGLLERHLDWVTARRRHLRTTVYGARLAPAAESTAVVDSLAGYVEENGDGSSAGRLMRLDQVHWLPDDVLMKADRASMFVGLEMRTPYLQRELAEFAATVGTPTHLAGNGKHLLRRLVGQLHPAGDERRRKTAFRTPGADWLRGPLRSVLAEQVAQGSIFAEGWFNSAGVAQLVADHDAGRRDRSQALWPILAFGLWLDRLRGRDVQ